MGGRGARRGQALVLAAVLLPFLLAIVGLAIDGAMVFAVRRGCQGVADGAARAGAMELDIGTYRRSDGDVAILDTALAGQEAHLFNSTIRANLGLARPGATDAELRDALARARIGEWVDSLPDGLDTLVGEEGVELSGGQRQRLTIEEPPEQRGPEEGRIFRGREIARLRPGIGPGQQG